MEDIFVTAVKLLKVKGYIKLENYIIDGTKIESAAWRYRLVWKKGVERNEKKLDEKLRGYIGMAEDLGEEEKRVRGKGSRRTWGEGGIHEQRCKRACRSVAGRA
jgi:hypothetical protein